MAVRSSLVPHLGRCEIHGKLWYTDRHLAKKVIRRLRGSGMREYRCTVRPDWWHVGHLPQATVQGAKTATEVYQRSTNTTRSTP